MTNVSESVLALQMAIQTEKDGRAFYLNAARETHDPQGRELFARLADDEIAHQTMLEKQLASVTESGQWSMLEAPAATHGPHTPIFARRLNPDELNALTSDLSALRVAFLREQDAIEFYTRAGERAAAPEAKKMYRSLVQMEQQHYDLLHGEYVLLSDQFKLAMGFEPF